MALATMAMLGSAALAGPPRVAVVVTSNRSSEGEPDLKFADSDGDRVATTLSELGAFDADHVVRARAATRERVEGALGRAVVLASQLRDEDELPEVLVYYAGHGGEDGLHLADDVLPLAELKAAARVIPASRRIFVLDACHSGQMMRSMGATLESVSDAPIAADTDFEPPPDEAWITSTGPEQDAYEADQRKGALFSHFFVSGIRGSADSDGDQHITLEEVYDFAKVRTASAAARSGKEQQPRWAGTHGQWSVTNLHRARSGIETAGPVPNDLLVVDSKTARVAAELPAGSGYRIALPKGRYQLIALDGDEVRSMAVTVKDGFEKIAPAVGLAPSTELRARGGLLIQRPWTIRAGVAVLLGALGRDRVGGAPFVQVTRATGRGHRVGAQLGGLVLPYQSEWHSGILGGATLAGVWGLDLSPRPMWLGPTAAAGIGYGGRTSRRREVEGLGAWYGTDTAPDQGWGSFGTARAGLASELPLLPLGGVMLFTELQATLRADFAGNRDAVPGVSVRIGLGSRE